MFKIFSKKKSRDPWGITDEELLDGIKELAKVSSINQKLIDRIIEMIERRSYKTMHYLITQAANESLIQEFQSIRSYADKDEIPF